MMQWHDTWSLYWAVPTLLLWIGVIAALVHAAGHARPHHTNRR